MNETIMIILGLAIILLVLYLLIKFNSKFRKNVYGLFLYAETNVIKGRKMEYVVNQIYDILPFPFTILPKSFYKKLLQDMFNEVHDMLDDGKKNNSNKKEGNK